jgi:hypothetical protein
LCFHLTLIENVFSQIKNDYLSTAIKTANWLISMEHEELSCDGLSWPCSNISDMKFSGLDQGTAGIGLFFLQLYFVTHDSLYLNKTLRAANYAYQEYSRGNLYGHDWLAGAAGGGDFFIALYKATKDIKHLQKAEQIAEWLIYEVISDEKGYYWRHYPDFPKLYTGIAHGGAGIGLFYLNLFEQTNNEKYLEIAKGAFNWIFQYTVIFDDSSLGWKRLTTDSYVYHLWCGGSTGIIFFLEKLYKVTNDLMYKNYFTKTANGLIKYAVLDMGGFAWPYTTEGGGLPIIYCHGTASTVHALLVAYNILNEQRYLDCARTGIEWLKNVKNIYNSSSYYWAHIKGWDQFETGLMTGTASVGHAFIKYYEYDPNPVYITYALGAANYLLEIADMPAENQVRWINYTNPRYSENEPKAYYTGWYAGAAGIGIFLLELHNVLNTGKFEEPNEQISPGNAGDEKITIKNFPNPFNETTTLQFKTSYDALVSIFIYNIQGAKVKTFFIRKNYRTGIYSILWDGSDDLNNKLASGIYFVQIKANNRINSAKVMLIR